MSRGLGSSSQERPCPGPDPGPWPPDWPEEGEGAETVPLGKRMISGLQGKGVGAEPAKSRATGLVMTLRHLLSSRDTSQSDRWQTVPVDEGRSSHTRLVSGVRLLQSPSEWTEDTDDGLSPPDRPGPGDLALRPFERPLLFEDFPPPTDARGRSLVLRYRDKHTSSSAWRSRAAAPPPPTVPCTEELWIAVAFLDMLVL